jgi:hypothetical protein
MILAYGIVAAGWAIWIPIFLRRSQQVQHVWWGDPFSLWDLPLACFGLLFDEHLAALSPSLAVIAVVVCGAALLALLWKAKAGDWYVVCLTAVPVCVSISVSVLLGRSLIITRYLAFVQPFLLLSFAVLLSRLAGRLPRNIAACVLIVGGLTVHVGFLYLLDIPKKPGAQAAAKYVAMHRHSGEPVIACSTLLYFPMLYHSQNRTGWQVYYDGDNIPHYLGSAAIIPEDIITRDQMEAIRSDRAWVVSSSGAWARRPMHIPPHWVYESEERFPEMYLFQKDIAIIRYTIPRQPFIRSPRPNDFKITD